MNSSTVAHFMSPTVCSRKRTIPLGWVRDAIYADNGGRLPALTATGSALLRLRNSLRAWLASGKDRTKSRSDHLWPAEWATGLSDLLSGRFLRYWAGDVDIERFGRYTNAQLLGT